MRKRNTKYLLSIFAILITASLFTSCSDRVITPTRSLLSVSFDTEEVDSETVFTLNTDEIKGKGELTITGLHYNEDDSINETAYFTFECAGVVLPKSQNKITLTVNDFPKVGTYIIKAKSSVNETLDKAFVLTLTSNITALKVEYTLISKNNANLAIDKDDKSGTLSEDKKSVTFIRDGEYSLNITALNGESVERVYIENVSPLITFTSDKTNTFKITINGSDKENGTIKFVAPFHGLSLTITFKIKDISSISIKEDKTQMSEEKVPILALKPTELERNYDVVVNALGDDALLEFSLDAEIVENEKFYDGSVKNYKPSLNKNATWYKANSLTYSYNGEPYYQASFNGHTKALSIKPLKATTFILGGKEENLHSYLYIKYEDDATYRWKYRIIVGGKLENISLLQIEGESETELQNKSEIIISENTALGWTFRPSFTPENITERECLWYLAKVNSYSEYKNEDGTSFSAPTPVEQGSIFNKMFNFMYTTPYTLGASNGGLRVASYSITAGPNNSDENLYISYSPLSEDINLVCINKKTKLYTLITFKNRIKNTVTVKSIGMYGSRELGKTSFSNMKLSKSINVKNNNGVKSIQTPYTTSDETQQYPQTIDKVNAMLRTFYMAVNSRITLEIENTEEIKTLACSVDEVGKQVLVSPSIDIDAINSRKARITLQTEYNSMLIEGKSPVYTSYLTDEDGSIIKVKLNGDTVILLRIIVYSD